MEDQQDLYFQYATLGVLGLTFVVCLAYTLVFFNPRLLPMGMRPATPTTQAMLLPPTWTPTPTITRTPTPSLTPTPRETATPLPTETLPPPPPTATLMPTPTSPPAPPTSARTATRRPPTAMPAPPTPLPANVFRLIKQEPAPNCGTWYVQGTVWDRGYGNGFLPGTLVRVVSNGLTYTVTAGSFNRNNPAYWEVVFGPRQEQNGVVFIVGSDGRPLSPQYPFRLTSNCRDGDVNQIIMDFARQ